MMEPAQDREGENLPCAGYFVHPFKKVAPWAFIVYRFLVIRWDSAIERAGKGFHVPEKTGGEKQQTIRKGKNTRRERAATDRFNPDAPTWIDLGDPLVLSHK